MSTLTPNPLTVFANRKAPVVPAPPKVQAAVIANIKPSDPGNIVRPGYADQVQTSIHDGVVKTKHLRKGQRVRPFVHGKPQGGERIVAKSTRIDDGAFVEVEWASGHPTSQHKAAYRWYDESLDGAPIQTVVKVPALVSYQEI